MTVTNAMAAAETARRQRTSAMYAYARAMALRGAAGEAPGTPEAPKAEETPRTPEEILKDPADPEAPEETPGEAVES